MMDEQFNADKCMRGGHKLQMRTTDGWKEGRLTLLSAHEALAETRLLLERLEGPTTLLSDHVSNFLDVRGEIPNDRDAMLAEIDAALQWPLGRFRPPTEKLVGMNL